MYKQHPTVTLFVGLALFPTLSLEPADDRQTIIQRIRRIVTGHDAEGRAVILSDNKPQKKKPDETKTLGDTVLDPVEQVRWCRAILFGSLPYMWLEQATAIRQMMIEKLQFKPGPTVSNK